MVTVNPLFLLFPSCQVLSDIGQAQNSAHVGSSTQSTCSYGNQDHVVLCSVFFMVVIYTPAASAGCLGEVLYL